MKKRFKVLFAVFSILSILTVMSIACFADGSTTNNLQGFIDQTKTALADFSTSNLAIILVAALSITLVLVLAWFAYRFITRKAAGAMKKGKV